MSRPGGGDYPLPDSIDLLPGQTPNPAQQHELDLRDSLDEASTLEGICRRIQNDPASSGVDKASCSCYEGALSIIRGELTLWAEYNSKNDAYNNYLEDKAAWDQRFRRKKDELTRLKSNANCGACGTQQNCNKKNEEGDWENVKRIRGCGFLSAGCKNQCRLTDTGLDRQMASWEVANPPPPEPQNPFLPQDVNAINFQCCVNEVSGNITIEEAAEIFQSCTQTISNDLDLDPAERKEVDKETDQLADDVLNTTTAVAEREKRSAGVDWTLIGVIIAGVVVVFGVVALLWLWSDSKSESSQETS